MSKPKLRATSLMDMPDYIHCEIFSLLPPKQLMIMKCVCKPLSSFLSSKVFFDFMTKPLQYFIQFSDTTKWLLEIESNTNRVLNSTPLEPLVPFVGCLKTVGTCEGIICFANIADEYSVIEDNFVLWNPLTNYFKYLPLPNLVNYISIHSSVFISCVNDDYKIIKLVKNNIPLSEIYNFSTNTWAIGPQVDCFPDDAQIRSSSFVVSTADHVYWTLGLFVCSSILAFDTRAGLFYCIDPPHTGFVCPPGVVDFNFTDRITVLDGSLSYVTWVDQLSMRIWIHVNNEWNLFWTGDIVNCPLSYWMRETFLSSLYPCYYFYNIGTGQTVLLDDYATYGLMFAGNFVGSLAPVSRQIKEVDWSKWAHNDDADGSGGSPHMGGDQTDATSNILVNENAQERLISLHGCSESEAFPLLNERNLECANRYAYGDRAQVAASRNYLALDHTDANSSLLVKENVHGRLISLSGCCESEAFRLLNDRWAATMDACNNPLVDLGGRPIMYSGSGASARGHFRLPDEMDSDFLNELKRAIEEKHASSNT